VTEHGDLGLEAPHGEPPRGARTRRLGPLGIALAILVLISIVLAAFYCTFPWSMVCRPPSH
jgi:hypothetical protein